MSGPRRLPILLTVLWVAFWILAYPIGGQDVKWTGVALASSPVALAWGIWWVWRGFTGTRATSTRSDRR